MPMPGAVEPRPLPSRESRFSVPLGGAGSVVFRGIGQDFQLTLHVHALNPFDSVHEFARASIPIDSAGPVSFILEHIMNK